MKCTKCLLIFINVLYMCTSVLILAAGIIAKIFFGKYDFLSNGISIFSTLWIVAGGCLLFISIFGIIISFGSCTSLLKVYQCCGGKSPDDWLTLRTTVDATNKNVPLSCCTREIDDNTSNYYRNGCLNLMQEMVSNNVTIISLFALVLAVVQMIGVFAAYLHNNSIKNSQKLDDVDYSQLTTKNHKFF